jgi:hypothetical protein
MPPHLYILDANGVAERTTDLARWLAFLAEAMVTHVGIVAQDRLAMDPLVLVSTIFLGLDHSGGDGRPLLWQTLILGGLHDGFCRLYATRADAHAGHLDAVRIAKE